MGNGGVKTFEWKPDLIIWIDLFSVILITPFLLVIDEVVLSKYFICVNGIGLPEIPSITWIFLEIPNVRKIMDNMIR